MEKEELINNLKELGVDKNNYSLDGELIPDSIILYSNYSKWEVFYLDEKGARNDYKYFDSLQEAYNYIYNLFLEYRTGSH